MALINTLRNKMGKVVVALIAVAIISFVMADLLGPNSSLFGGNDNQVGEIAGEDISLEEFQGLVQQQESNYVMSFNRQPGEREKPTLRNQAWELLIARYAFEKQYEEVGIEVTSDEVWDMMQGKNISPGIQQSFTNPETGEFDRDLFLNFLQQLPNAAPEQRYRWEIFKKDLKPGRERIKYENLLVKSVYATNAEGQMEYQAQNNVAEVKYLYVPFYAIGDSAVTVSDSDLKSYYNDHKEQYKVENTRSLKYVSFPVIASAADSAFIKEELNELKEEFKTVKDDSTFAGVNTDGNTFFSKYQAATLPRQLGANVSNLSKGDVRGPYLNGEYYDLFKVSDIYEDTVDYAKASHILFGEGEEAKQEAERVLEELQNGANFSAMAAQYGTDGTKSRGGDLGWFKTGDMVEEFEDVIFSANGTGLINRVVETEYGYHIVRVDETKTNTVYKVATIQRNITPGDETINEAFRDADLFASQIDDLESFEEAADNDSLNVRPAEKLKKNDRRVGVLGDARQIVQWLFRDASVGDISEVFELDDQYVVAVMTGETEEGYQSLNNVRAEVTAKVKNELKGKQIIEKLQGLSGSLEDKATAYGDDANVYTSSDLKLSANSLPTVGYDPYAVGKAFSLENGESTEPFASENGVLIIEMLNKTVAPEIADYSIYKTQMTQNARNRVGFSIGEAIKENADINDKRYKFY
ncbi:foldase [Fulvivirga sp. RKSG066]|uniref:peptidylprolyl isomerase n=1 Tax=Fulvivirga aurantia TaxID=2529383 RepID=UPI0012BCD02C|nr:peptidylprolyl isomerase [Fulvivirga aurantia]MTI22161.1 foldase [Fulvivirga aurantia]